jgi:hypothetical protein
LPFDSPKNKRQKVKIKDANLLSHLIVLSNCFIKLFYQIVLSKFEGVILRAQD